MSTRSFTLLFSLALLALQGAFNTNVVAQTITTVVGGIGNDTMAVPYARIKDPDMVVSDGGTGLYIFEKILGGGWRKLNTATGRIVAATGGGKGVFDAAGNWIYAESPYVKKRTPAGVVTILAGNGSTTYSGDGGSALLAGLTVADVGMDAAGNLYICDKGNKRVRKVTPAGFIATIAGTGGSGSGGDGGAALSATFNDIISIVVDAAGNVYVADQLSNRVRKISTAGIISTVAGGGSTLGDGGPATAASVTLPAAVKLNAAGELIIAMSNRIRKVDAAGIITTIAGTGTNGFSGDGGPATAAKFAGARDMTIDGADNIYITDYTNSRIRKIAASGIITTVAGNGLPLNLNTGNGGDPLLASFLYVAGIATDTAGNLCVADGTANLVRRIHSTADTIGTIAGNGFAGYYGDGGSALSAALSMPVAITYDRWNNMYIAETGSDHVRKVSPAGIITTIAGGGLSGPGDGGPATAAALSADGVAVDSAGNVYIADNTSKKLRRVDALTGIITTVAGNDTATTPGDGGPATAASLVAASGVTLDGKGNIYIGGTPVRKINAAGVISSLPFNAQNVAIDTIGNLYFYFSAAVYRYDTFKYISRIAGNGVSGYTGDGGPAIAAQTTNSTGAIHLGSNGRLYFASINGVRSIYPLSTVIDAPPVFTKGVVAAQQVCMSSATNSLDTSLRVSDINAGQTLTWTVISNPSHGTLSGFPATAVATGGTVTPTGLTYAPTAGYTGGDYFYVRVSDGEDTARIQVTVSVVNASYTISLTGNDVVCVGSTKTMNANVANGTWTISNGNATLSPQDPYSVNITGVAAGTATLTYAATSVCGTFTGTATVTVNQLPVVPVITTTDTFMCKGATLQLSATPAGGTWAMASSYATVVGSTGIVTAYSAGNAVVVYRLGNSCGYSSDTIRFAVLAAPVPGYFAGNGEGCMGGAVAASLYGQQPGGVYTFSVPGIADIDTGNTIKGIAAGTTVVSYTLSNTCGSVSATKQLQVLAAPASAPVTGKSFINIGQTVTLRGASPNGLWYIDDTTIATINSWGELTGIAAGNASVTYSETADNGCVATVKHPVHVTSEPAIKFSAIPNPASRQFSIAYEFATVSAAEMKLIDATGKLCYRRTLSLPSSEGKIPVNVTGIPAGVYLMVITTTEGDHTLRVTIIEQQ